MLKWPSWMIFDIGQWIQLEGDHTRAIWTIFDFMLSNGSEERDFHRVFNPSEATTDILDVAQCHWTHL